MNKRIRRKRQKRALILMSDAGADYICERLKDQSFARAVLMPDGAGPLLPWPLPAVKKPRRKSVKSRMKSFGNDHRRLRGRLMMPYVTGE